MTGTVTAQFTPSDIDWPKDVKIALERVLRGAPAASTFPIEDTPSHQVGLWRVTPGAFTTDHTGYAEFIQIISGVGRLIDEDGAVIDLHPGVTVFMSPGWKGRWVVLETITKVYTVLPS